MHNCRETRGKLGNEGITAGKPGESKQMKL